MKDFLLKLLSAFDVYTVFHAFAGTPEEKSRPSCLVNQAVSPEALFEPLSERELEVLKLLRTDLSGPEIAGHLIVSLNTFRTHTKNIYIKLGVNNRRAAIHQAEELDLFN